MDLTGLQLPGGLIYEFGALMLLVGLTWATYRIRSGSSRNDRSTREVARDAYDRVYAKRSDRSRRRVGPS